MLRGTSPRRMLEVQGGRTASRQPQRLDVRQGDVAIIGCMGRKFVCGYSR